MIKVSVVIPVYNVEKYLPACLDSVLNQTLGDIEIICIDDASPDRCGEILDGYAGKDGRVRVFHLTENRRQGYGRNLGMDNASGKYIYFLDSDDMITPTALEELYALAEEDDLRGIFFDSTVIYDTEQLGVRFASYPSERYGEYPDDAVSGPELFELFMRQNEWTCYVQRQIWDLEFLRRNGIRFPDGVEHEDELFTLEGVLLADRVRYLRKRYFIRRYREQSVMTTPHTAKNFHGYFMNFVLMDEFCRRHGIECDAAERVMARMSHYFERYYSEMKEKEDLSAWFREKEMPYFDFYDRLRSVQVYENELDPEIHETLGKAGRIYVYGAGALGKKAVQSLAANGLAVDGVVVTRTEGNPSVIMGHRVMPVSQLHADRRDTVILLAMTKGFSDEVQPKLETDGWTCVRFE